MVSSGRPWVLNIMFMGPKAECMDNAAPQALVAWSSTLSGVFQKASTPSPCTSATTPSLDSTISVISERYSVRRDSNVSCVSFSEMLVKSRMSEKRTVTIRLSTCSRAARSSPRTMLLTIVSGTKCANASIPRARRTYSFCSLATSRMCELREKTICSKELWEFVVNLKILSARMRLLICSSGCVMQRLRHAPIQTQIKAMIIVDPRHSRFECFTTKCVRRMWTVSFTWMPARSCSTRLLKASSG
mmetsp:Transcript_109669/g.333442  ORF Transcript_109669/g.333442 Transcript_109669/m.333442 type:complete len:245 (+) Transcript_109669:490-1224(+)